MKTSLNAFHFPESRLVYLERQQPSKAEKVKDEKSPEGKQVGFMDTVKGTINDAAKAAAAKAAEQKEKPQAIRVSDRFNPKLLTMPNGVKYEIINKVKDRDYELVAEINHDGYVGFSNGGCGEVYQDGVLGFSRNGSPMVMENPTRRPNPFLITVDEKNHTITVAKPELGYSEVCPKKTLRFDRQFNPETITTPDGKEYSIIDNTNKGKTIVALMAGKRIEFDHGGCSGHYSPGSIEMENGRIVVIPPNKLRMNPMIVTVNEISHTITISPPKYGYVLRQEQRKKMEDEYEWKKAHEKSFVEGQEDN